MGIASLWLAGIGVSIVQFFVLGSACLALAERYGLFPSLRYESRLLLPPAIGVCFSSLAVAFAVLTRTQLNWQYLAGCLGLALALIALAVIFARPFFLNGIRAYLERPLVTVLIVLGAIIGTGAYLQFPAVPDSGQILWTQALMDGQTVNLSAMLGYSGILAPVARLFDVLPIMTSAAAYKPLLGILVCLAAYFALTCLDIKNIVLASLVFIALILMSAYGLMGVVERGKDSVFGVAFLLCFFGTLCRRSEDVSGLETAIFFAAATMTGIITVPYMLAGYFLWLILSENPGDALRTVGPMIALNALFLPPAIDGFLPNVGIVEVAAAYVLVGAACLVAVRFLRISRPLPLLGYWRPLLPAILLLACIPLLPVAVPIVTAVGLDGIPQTELRPPTDGGTDFWQYMFADGRQWGLIALGLLSTSSVGFTRVGRQRAGVVATTAMPFFVLLLILIRSHAEIPILSGFNIWDLVRDIPQWLAGPLFGLLIVVVAVDLVSRLPRGWPQSVASISSVVLTIFVLAGYSHVPLLYRGTVVFTATGGSRDPEIAVVSDITWRTLRGKFQVLDMSLPFSANYFYVAALYGAKPVQMDTMPLDQLAEQDTISFVVSKPRLGEVLDWARARRASVTYRMDVGRGVGGLVIVKLDGKGTVKLPKSLRAPSFAEGAYGTERSDSWGSFSWTRAQSKIFVPGIDPGSYCLTVRMFALSGSDSGARLVSISGLGASTTVDISASTPSEPASAALAVTVGPQGGMLKLSANFPEIVFAHDARPIAFGTLLPFKRVGIEKCRAASNVK